MAHNTEGRNGGEDDEMGMTMGSTNNMGKTTDSMAGSFKGRSTAKTADELKKARESRAADALRMKDEQLKILSDQNASLLSVLDKVEDDANTIQMEKLAIEQENRSIRDSNFELQSKARAAETQSKRMTAEVADKEKQLRIMTDQNSELLRLLESEEGLTGQLQSEVAELRAELDEIRQKHGSLLTTAKTHEELATKAAREGQLRAEEIRLLRAETEQLKQQNAELKMKTQVEVEAFQEQLRVRKEKQYQLLEKLQAQEEAKRQAEDQVAGMEDQLRGLHARNIELETQLQVEVRSKQSLEETNKELQLENGNLYNQTKDLQVKIEKSEKERLRMEAEARDSGEQLREMAEKVFQLLERLKLAELGKTKAMEALKKKEQDMVGLQKKNARLIKEATEEGRARVKAELDIKVLQDQVRSLKHQNQGLAVKSKDEAAKCVRANEELDQANEKLRTMESRLSFLLNKVQADEENRLIQAEDRKKLEAQVLAYTEKCDELTHKLSEMGESNRVITQAMRLKQEELNEVSIKFESLTKELEMREANEGPNEAADMANMVGATPGQSDDIENVRLNEGRGRFYVEAKSVGGGSMLILRGRKPLYREWIDRQGANDFLKRSQKTTRFRDLIVEKFAGVYGLLMVEEEEKNQYVSEVQTRERQIEHLQKKLAYVQDSLATEEDAKRRMLLRYIHAVKEHSIAVNEGSGGILQLPESNISDEEVHALAALLRNNMNIDELNLRGNNITDDGARALGAVLAGRSSLRLIDLRGNKIGKGAIRILAEALERSERVRHVYVHAGGKIDALGAGRWANSRTGNGNPNDTGGPEVDQKEKDAKLMVTVETVCVVDCRDNNPDSILNPYELGEIDGLPPSISSGSPVTKSKSNFNPLKMLEVSGAPNKGVITGPQHAKEAKETKKMALQKAHNKLRASADDIKANSNQLRGNMAVSMKESSWQGRAGGLDGSLDGGEKESLRLTKSKKNAQRGDLAPIEDRGTSRGRSAPDLHGGLDEDFDTDVEAEDIVKNAILKARRGQKGKHKTKGHSGVEKNLFRSPFAQPIVKDNTNTVKSSSPQH
jgi:myosin protein heavy chain